MFTLANISGSEKVKYLFQNMIQNQLKHSAKLTVKSPLGETI